MAIADEAHAVLLIADYVGVDAAGKLNILGAGFAITGIQPSGLTAPMYVAALIDVPSKYVGQEFAVGLVLMDDNTGQIVQAVGPTGQLEALRVAQVLRVNPPNLPGAYIPESVPSRVQLNVAFQTGLPLAPGHVYQWRLEIDGQYLHERYVQFHVLGPPPGPVFGGPTGPSTLPTLDER